MARIHLPAGHVLTVTADARGTGSVKRMGITADVAGWSIAESTSTTIGPFLEDREYDVHSDSGPLTTSIAPAQSSGNAGAFILSFPLQLAALGTSAADLLTAFTPGFRFRILSASFAVTSLGVGSGAEQVLSLAIGETPVTGGVLTLDESATDTLGKLTAATAITAGDLGSAADTLSIQLAADGTVFTAGAGNLLLRLQNLDV